MVTSVNHTGLVVADLDKMVEFYTQQLGLKVLLSLDSNAPPEGDHTGIPGARRKLVFLGLPNDHRIELVYYIDPPAEPGYLDKHQLGAIHLCFDVADLRATYDKLSTQGVRFVTEPQFHEIGGKTLGIVYAQDPEGNWIEFIEGFEAIL